LGIFMVSVSDPDLRKSPCCHSSIRTPARASLKVGCCFRYHATCRTGNVPSEASRSAIKVTIEKRPSKHGVLGRDVGYCPPDIRIREPVGQRWLSRSLLARATNLAGAALGSRVVEGRVEPKAQPRQKRQCPDARGPRHGTGAKSCTLSHRSPLAFPKCPIEDLVGSR
jgi:hypothetical protein